MDHIHTIWKKIFGESTMAMQSTDNDTVRALELTCPKYSPADRRNVRLLLEKGQIFRGIDLSEREHLWKNLMRVDCIIPSLFSFFEDAKYLLPCARNIKYIIGSQNEMTIYRALQRCFHQVEDSPAQTQLIVEKEEAVYEIKATPLTLEERFDIGRRQLWLYAMRHFAQVAPPSASSGEWRIASVGSEIANESVLCGFASLACRLGFRNDDILRLKQRSPEREIACRALLQARPPGMYKYDGNSFESYLDQMEKFMNTAERRHGQPDETDIWRDGGETRHRCGCPGRDDNQINKKYLFHDKILQPHSPAEGVTSLFVRKCVFLAFFGGDFVQRSIEPASVQRRQKEHGPKEQQQNLARLATSCDFTETTGRHQTLLSAPSHRRTSYSSPGSSMSVRSSELALVRSISACVTEELDDNQLASEQTLIRRESSREITSRTPPNSPLRLGEPWITFISREHNEWRFVSQFPKGDSSGIEQAAETFMANGLRPFTIIKSRMQPIFPHECYDAALSSPAQNIILIPENKAHITSELISSAEGLRFGSEAPRRESRYSPGPSASSVYSTQLSSKV